MKYIFNKSHQDNQYCYNICGNGLPYDDYLFPSFWTMRAIQIYLKISTWEEVEEWAETNLYDIQYRLKEARYIDFNRSMG